MMFLDEHTLRIISEEGFDTLFDIKDAKGTSEENKIKIISTCRIDNHDTLMYEDDHAILQQVHLDQGADILERLIRKNALLKVTKRHVKNMQKN
jgi:hypothetical protein